MKKIIIIAGPNGAGKTTLARDLMPAETETLRFINADLIADGLALFNPESVSFKAGRLMLQEIDDCVHAGRSFVFETTLSGLSCLRKIQKWQKLGYKVKLCFLSLPDEEAAISRVENRVSQGGQTIPEKIIRRRYKAGLNNFHNRYSEIVDAWFLYDSFARPPKLINWKKFGPNDSLAPTDPDSENLNAAILRAAHAAEETAIKTDTSILVSVNGKSRRISAAELLQKHEDERACQILCKRGEF